MILKNIRFLVTQNEEREIKEGVDLRIYGGHIEEIGENLDCNGKEIDCSNKIVMPGLINCHTHVSMTIMRGIEDNETMEKWLFDNVRPAEQKMKEKHVKAGASIGIREMLKSGTTCFNDMYFHESKVAEAAEELGIRATLGNGIVDKGQDLDSEMESSIKFIREYNESDIVNPVVCPHSVYTCSDEAMKRSIQQAEEFDIPIHIHVSETRKENQQFMEETGLTPVQYLKKEGVLQIKTVAAHCTHLTQNDIEILKENEVGIVHCPIANLKLGSGIAEVPEMLENNLKVGLGTDGPASNNSLDLFQEMKTAALIQKEENPEVMDAQQVLDMATVNGADILGIDKLGRVKETRKADLITVDIEESMRPCRKENVVSNLVFSNPTVSETIVDGELLVENGEFEDDYSDVDFEKLSSELW